MTLKEFMSIFIAVKNYFCYSDRDILGKNRIKDKIKLFIKYK